MDYALTSLIASAVTAMLSYLIARRRSSGSVATSEAAELWAESGRLRSEMRTRIADLEGQLQESRLANEGLREINRQLTEANSGLRDHVEHLLEVNRHLAEEIRDSKDTNRVLLERLRDGSTA